MHKAKFKLSAFHKVKKDQKDKSLKKAQQKMHLRKAMAVIDHVRVTVIKWTKSLTTLTNRNTASLDKHILVPREPLVYAENSSSHAPR